jgi:hypothetical protein
MIAANPSLDPCHHRRTGEGGGQPATVVRWGREEAYRRHHRMEEGGGQPTTAIGWGREEASQPLSSDGGGRRPAAVIVGWRREEAHRCHYWMGELPPSDGGGRRPAATAVGWGREEAHRHCSIHTALASICAITAIAGWREEACSCSASIRHRSRLIHGAWHRSNAGRAPGEATLGHRLMDLRRGARRCGCGGVETRGGAQRCGDSRRCPVGEDVVAPGQRGCGTTQRCGGLKQCRSGRGEVDEMRGLGMRRESGGWRERGVVMEVRARA